ncbi:MAG TPA: serine hydrolase domain-containing protein [Candidatus Acidoferrum sp.]|nr:serine hydrolase domain-containing protein [Candidatus Acidoferrum sp.]
MAACALVAGTCSVSPPSRAQDKATAAVDEVFADLTKAGSPGCAVAVYRNGRISYSKGYGLANLEEDVPITPGSVFDIGSTSKQFTAASILLLEKQGKLSVNDDVRKYIPELPDYGPKITLLHLLNHTSGLRDYLTLMDLAGINTDSVTTDEDALQIITRQKALNFAPGSDWLYSNSGFFLLSIVVKRASGKTLREFAAENIFAPLGMTHTQYRDDHTALIPDRAMAYDPKEKKDGYTLDVSYFEQTGDGAVHTSVEDLLKWDENFYSGQVGGKDFLAEIQEPGKLNSGKVLDYAKGLHIADYRGLHTVSHGGSWGGYRAELLRFPEHHFSVACLCNRGDANPTKRAVQVADIYLGSMMKPKEEKKAAERETPEQKEIPLTAEQLRRYTGDYWSGELGVTYRLGIVDGKLRVVGLLDGGGFLHTSTLSPEGFGATAPDVFRFTKMGITLHFERDANEAITGFKLDAGRTLGMIFTRRDGAGK